MFRLSSNLFCTTLLSPPIFPVCWVSASSSTKLLKVNWLCIPNLGSSRLEETLYHQVVGYQQVKNFKWIYKASWREFCNSRMSPLSFRWLADIQNTHSTHATTFFLRGIQTAKSFCLLQNSFKGSVRAKSNCQLKDIVRHIRGNLVTAKRMGVFRIYSNYFKCWKRLNEPGAALTKFTLFRRKFPGLLRGR